ncbi:MAG: hypothetical protein J5793_01390 [Clostridia bacterium]|nr:hypothetical protein [Clostridia bacterium]
MPKKPKKDEKKPDILELLRQAEEQNNSDMNFDRSAPRANAAKPEKKAKAEPEKEKSDGKKTKPKKRTKVTKRINAETAEIIDKYSTYDGEKKMSDTQKLREKLAKQSEGEALLGYIADDKTHVAGERVEKLYEMINDAKTRTMSDAEKKPPEWMDTHRFTEDVGYSAPVYTQEQMFPMGESIKVGAEEREDRTAEYDEEYDSLTEKVTGAELTFSGDEEHEGQIRFIDDDESLAVLGSEFLDETDKKLRVAFDMMNDDGTYEKAAKHSEEERKRGKDERASEKTIRYTDRSQNNTVAAMYRKKVRRSLIKIILIAVFTAGILFLEIATKNSSIHNEYTRQGKYGMLYVLIDLQLLFFIALTLLDAIKHGIKGIFSLHLNTDSLLVVSVFFAAAYSVVIIFTDPSAADLKLYNLPAAFAALCSAVMTFLTAKKDYRCFRVIASKRVKYAACELTGGTREADEFDKYLFEDSEIYTVRRAKFIDGFVERTEKRSKFEDVFNFLIPVIFFAGAVLFVVMMIMGRPLVESYASFSVLIASSVPASAFFMISLPSIFANRVAAKHQSAFIGNAISEEYASATVLSFADTEVYPSSLVKITNIRMYGDYRIDTVLTDLAKLFGYVGGPLAKVLSGTLSDKVDKPSSIRLIESAADGLCVAMEGRNYFLGKRTYMRRYRFEAPVDDGDDAYERAVGSIMYVIINEHLAAKLYIKYSVNPLFDSLLKDMYKAGLCLGIKTLDPNISNDLISNAIKFRKCPISVLRGMSPDDVIGEVDRVDSGIACNSTLHNFLKMFALCEKTRHVTKSNVIISIVSVFLSFAAIAFLAVTGGMSAVSSLHALAFQLFWLLPVWSISYFMK